MDKNKDIYCACLLLFSASEFLHKHDEEFSNFLLDKTKEMIGTIKVDNELIKEVEDYAREIEQSIDKTS